ncbi:MAG: hypothetical protein FJ291_08600 [Planctomycetes bacterium]|nr:hypothetical protein [Planctomycetota bacterium]
MFTNRTSWMGWVLAAGLLNLGGILRPVMLYGGPEPVDLNGPDYNPPDCPAWAKVTAPEWVKPHIGVNGVPEKWRPKGEPFGSSVAGLDRYQANHFVYCDEKTVEYLYKEYTPLKVNYAVGTLPTFEKVAARYTAGCKTDTGRAVALVTRAMPAVFKHPVMPPLGPSVAANRNMEDKAMLATGCGWCNEQARVFIRLCQVLGIPARMVHLFGQGHTVAEFHADGKWALADATNMFVVPGKDGKPMSALECHDRGANQRLYAQAKQRRVSEMLEMSDAELGFKNPAAAKEWRDANAKPLVEELAVRKVAFGVINYPLPK